MAFEAFPDSRLPRLPIRELHGALSELVPEQPVEPQPLNLVGVPAGEVVDRRFRIARLRRVRVVDDPLEPTA
ncbi:hypothetical protein [Streptomyces mirabilis]|uniref:Uncharacterized protein n=1 Tax=Streptomyces mirabilis TaxID=68239 RepID=A0ABU3V5B2_9ACTN|nr:hypothetical protein [Streptomyces mirabilis]MCX5355548.1 hypothetical protein [Streptomyces mirabilis]MDU9001195.1 hypothetical protein [Streptomyces mirabilis]